MKPKKNVFFFSILALAFLACAALWLWAGFPVTHISSADGMRDLRGADFASGSFDLLGPVEYIPNALLTPEEFDARQDEIQIGNPEQAARYSTSRLRVYVPVGTYGLMLYSTEFAASIYINGLLVESVGMPGSGAAQSEPGTKRLYYTAEAPNGVIEIVQQASTYAVPKGDSHANIIIGKPETVRQTYDHKNMATSIVMGCFLALFLAHLVLYSLIRRYTANLWAALFCLMWFFRTGFTDPWALSSFLSVPWDAAFRISCLAYPIGTLLFVLMLYSLFPGILQKWFRTPLYALCGLFACICLLASTVFVYQALTYFNIVILLTAAYMIVRLCMKLRKPNLEQATILIGMSLFLFGVVLDILYFDVLPASPAVSELTRQTMAEFSLLIFVFFQMAAMFHGTMRKINEAREAEQKMALENALLTREAKVREEMVRDLSHEIRTPLTVISTYAQLAMRQFRQGKIDEQVVDGLDAVYEEAQRIAELATDTLSPVEKDERMVDLAEVARQLIRLYTPVATAAGRKLTANFTKKLPVSGNVGEITQVIWNLLDNAVKHAEHGSIEVDGNLSDEFVHIHVTDYGAGIPPDMLERVMERGISDGGGSGLGLAIANEIAMKHGGRLVIESEYGMGTVATLILPIHNA